MNTRSKELLATVLLAIVLGVAEYNLGSMLSLLAAAAFCVGTVFLYRHFKTLHYSSWLLFGIVLHAVSVPWVAAVIEKFGGFSSLKSFLFSLILFTVASLQFLLFNFLVRRLHGRRLTRLALPIPLAWFAADILTPKFLDWNLAHSLVSLPTLIQSVDLFGVPVLGFFFFWVLALLIEVLRPSLSRRKRPIMELGTVLCLLVGYGVLRPAMLRQDIEQAPEIAIAMIQGNFDPQRDFSAERIADNIEKYQGLSELALKKPSASGNRAQLLIWGESTVGFDHQPTQQKINRGSDSDPYPGLSIPLIYGGQTRKHDPVLKRSSYYNSVFNLAPSGALSRYDKQELFPFSEYLPLGKLFPGFADLIDMSYVMRVGDKKAPLEVLLPAVRDKAIRIAIDICYEDTLPSVSRRAVSTGEAELLLGITNDNWFGTSVASRQHQVLAQMRAVENRRYQVRVTNHGISSVVSPSGILVTELEPFTEAFDTVSVKPLSLFSPYQLWGEVLAYLFCLWIVVVALSKQGRKKKC